MKNNFLITSVGGDIGGNIVNILKEQNEIKCSLIGVDIKKNVYSEDKLNFFYKMARVNSSEFFEKLKEIITKHKINLIIPSSELDILFFQENSLYFNNIGVKLLINSENIVNSFLDKLRTSTDLTKLKISTPKTYRFSKYSEQLNFPLILKAKNSTTTKKILKINNTEELNNVKLELDKKEKYIIQEYIGIEGEEYTTAVSKHNGETKVITFKRLLAGGMTGVAEIVESKQLEDYAKQIADKYKLNGSINIQSRKFNNDYFIFEINPRISSTVYIRNHFNFKDLLWWIADKLEIPLGSEINKHATTGKAVLGYTYRFF